ncbi:MAG: hypothetical protein BroJett006_09500 [Betaproteobacteria bacterium]|nr:MAG: hypothetical protein BroJett006_09500 [Betaproteobacteria bacterium]
MKLSRATAEYLLDLVRLEGGRTPEGIRARRELKACLAATDRPAPLLFTSRPHPTRPLRTWTFGTRGNEVEVPLGSTLDLGLGVLQLAVASPRQRVDIAPLDDYPLRDRDARRIEGMRVITARARDLVGANHPGLAGLLQRVKLHDDLTASFAPDLGDAEVVTDEMFVK